MRVKYTIVLMIALVGVLFIAGCTSSTSSPISTPTPQGVNISITQSNSPTIKTMVYFSGENWTTSASNPLLISNLSTMENNEYNISGSIDQLKFNPNSPNFHKLEVYMTIKNSGTETMSLACSANIGTLAGSDNSGSDFNVLLNPGDSQSGKSDIMIYSDENYGNIYNKSTLYVICMDKLPLHSQNVGQNQNETYISVITYNQTTYFSFHSPSWNESPSSFH